MEFIERIVADPAYHDVLAIVKGARNGLVYGAKIRFPHALVMAILFGRGDWRARARMVYRATKQHSLNLAKFVTCYKIALLLQRKANGGKPRGSDPFFAGLIGGYLIFGERNPVNEQIILYILSRVIASLIPRAPTPAGKTPVPGKPQPPDPRAFTPVAALVWASVMWLFAHRRETLQSGLVNSMDYLYLQSERWKGLRTLLWHNA